MTNYRFDVRIKEVENGVWEVRSYRSEDDIFGYTMGTVNRTDAGYYVIDVGDPDVGDYEHAQLESAVFEVIQEQHRIHIIETIG